MNNVIELEKDESNICEWLSQEFGLPCLDLRHYTPPPEVLALVPRDIAERYRIIPISRVGAVLSVCMENPLDLVAQDNLRFMSGYFVEPLVGIGISEAIERFYPAEEDEVEVVEDGIDLTCNIAIPSEPVHVPTLFADCEAQARHIPRKKEPDSYQIHVDGGGDVSFEIRAKQLIREAMKGK